MDPQKLSQLDPKLREAYQRVMGTQIPQPQAPSQTPIAPADNSSPIPNPIPTPVPEPAQPEPAIPTPTFKPVTPPQTPSDQQREPFFIPQPNTNPQPIMPTSEPPAPIQSASNSVQMNSEVAASPTAPAANFSNFATPAPVVQTMAVKKKNGMMPILFGIVGVVFLVIYTLFWTKIFNFKLPFLP